MTSSMPPPDCASLISPILPVLPPASAAPEPAPGVLPLLSPILRQRVQLLSTSSQEPWLKLLCYDPSKKDKLLQVAQSGNFEPHPISGEVEVDWGYDAQTRYRRLDEETLQAFVVVEMLELGFQLIWCVNDAAGGGDGWRIGGLTVPDASAPFEEFEGGVGSVEEAEKEFKNKSASKSSQSNGHLAPSTQSVNAAEEEEDDDDGYWAQYDATPANRTPAGRTPATKRSPAPGQTSALSRPGLTADEDDYFNQYDDVQPAMDNHDPDEAEQIAEVMPEIMPPLGAGENSNGNHMLLDVEEARQNGAMHHPRPESSASSNGERTVAKFEEQARANEREESDNEFGVKQHVSRTIRSLWQLSRSSGIDQEEFERMVKRELDILGMVQES